MNKLSYFILKKLVVISSFPAESPIAIILRILSIKFYSFSNHIATINNQISSCNPMARRTQ